MTGRIIPFHDDHLIRITEEGRRSLEEGINDVSSESLLCLVILDALGGEGWDSEINRLCDELIEHFGNAERAIDAILRWCGVCTGDDAMSDFAPELVKILNEQEQTDEIGMSGLSFISSSPAIAPARSERPATRRTV